MSRSEVAILPLPDTVFLLALRPGQDPHLPFRLETAVTAAVLAELRLRGRIGLDDDGLALEVRQDEPTGDDLLDDVLAQLATEQAQSPYEWLLRLREPVVVAVEARWRVRGIFEERPDGGLRWVRSPAVTAMYDDIRRSARLTLITAIESGEVDSRAMLLGFLLWGGDIVGSVLGWSFAARRRLGRLALRDWIGLSIRSLEAYIGVLNETTKPNGWSFALPVRQQNVEIDRSPAGEQRPRWLLRLGFTAAAFVIGGILISTPYRHQRGLDARSVELHRDGVPVSAAVVDREDKETGRGRNRTSTIVLSYWLDGRPYREEVLCEKGCGETGGTVRLWVAPEDPDEFVTEWGDHNEPQRTAERIGYVGWGVAGVGLLALLGPGPRLRPWRQLGSR